MPCFGTIGNIWRFLPIWSWPDPTKHHMTRPKYFKHNGDLGDIIYALPTIRALGGGKLALFNDPGVTSFQMSPQRVALISDLLIAQRYITDVEYSRIGGSVTDLTVFRRHIGKGMNLVDTHLYAMGLPSMMIHVPWIEVEPKRVVDVVVWRTPRWHSFEFPWKLFFERFGKLRVGFIGYPEEHREFVRLTGLDVTHIKTENLLDAARIIAGSIVCMGNQTCLAAIAHALAHPMILEIHNRSPLAVFNYGGLCNVYDPNFKFDEGLKHVG